jgi:aquaporin NIP
MADDGGPSNIKERRRAWFQLLIGQAQIIGATTGAILLLSIGVTGVMLVVVGGTLLISLFSRLYFHGGAAALRAWSMNKYLSEFFGTFGLVFAGTGAIVINQVSNGAITHVGIALTFGLIVLAMIYTFGDVSGAHLNPAVTVAFCVAGRFPKGQVLPYILSQCAGAFLASGLLRYLFRENKTLGATLPAGPAMQSFILELVLSFMLMLVILSVSTGAKEKGITAGIAVGSVIALEAMFAGPICGASMNPARSLSPAVVSANLQHLWIYLIAPTAGAVIATFACRFVQQPGCCDGVR